MGYIPEGSNMEMFPSATNTRNNFWTGPPGTDPQATFGMPGYMAPGGASTPGLGSIAYNPAAPVMSNQVSPFASQLTPTGFQAQGQPFNWLSNIGITSPDGQGGQITQAGNPMQWATPESAQRIGQMFGGTPFGMNINMPGGQWSQDQQMIGFQNGRSINAGLAGDLLNKYGSDPGSYGRYQVQRDIQPNYWNASSYDQWASGQPGYNPGTRAPGGEQVDPAFAAYASGKTANYDALGSMGAYMDSASRSNYSDGQTGAQTALQQFFQSGGQGGGSAIPGTPTVFPPMGGPIPPQPLGPPPGTPGSYGVGDTLLNAPSAGIPGSIAPKPMGPPNGSPGYPGNAPYFPGGVPPNGSYGTPASPLAPPGGFSGTPDQFLADSTNDVGYLRNIAQNAGFATNATPAWDAMVASQQRGLDRHYADLKAGMAASGNRFSSDFGNASVDYWNQANLDQNSLLGQMTFASQESARQRELSAAQSLGGYGFQGASQLSNQGFQATQADQSRQLQAALAFMGAGQNSAALMAQFGAQGAMGLQAGALQGAQGLFGTENNAASQEIQRQMLLQQMGLGAAQNASQLWQSNLGLGSGIAQQQFNMGTTQNSAAFQEWLRTQPQYNPLLSMIYQSATGYTPMVQPQYQPSWWQQALNSFATGAGQGAGAAATKSDRRLKENITSVGTQNGHNLYEFNYKGDSRKLKYIGVMADEVQDSRPDAVITGEDGFLKVDYWKIGIQFREAH